jgi:creatinine amidohydrolase
MQWSERTWAEFPACLEAVGGAAMLPVGATEQLGPHLGSGVDWVLADRLCAAVGMRTEVPVLPAMPYGCSVGHSRRWPGTIALKPTTLIEAVCEVGDWAYVSGVRRLFTVNTHVANAAPWKCCAPATTI